MSGLELRSFNRPAMVKLNFDIFEMRFVVCAGVKSNDLHALGCRRIAGKKQGKRQAQFQWFQQFQSFKKFGAREELTIKGHRRIHGLTHFVVRFLSVESLPWR